MIKKFNNFLCIFTFMLTPTMAIATESFVVQEVGDHARFLIAEGPIDKRRSPCSTFKIPLSVMGYDTGILQDITKPQYDYTVGIDEDRGRCYGTFNPQTWISQSCVWYSRRITEQLQAGKFAHYVQAFNYGNCDVSKETLTNSWLEGSLEISPLEQTIFLEKLLTNKLPASKEANEYTKQLLFREELPNGWRLFGKTGTGSDTTGKQLGWFVGWVQKNEQIFIFAYCNDSEVPNAEVTKYRCEMVKEKLAKILQR